MTCGEIQTVFCKWRKSSVLRKLSSYIVMFVWNKFNILWCLTSGISVQIFSKDINLIEVIWTHFFIKTLLHLLQYCFCFMFGVFGHKTCGKAPQPGIEHASPALEGKVLTTREGPHWTHFISHIISVCKVIVYSEEEVTRSPACWKPGQQNKLGRKLMQLSLRFQKTSG